MQIPPRLVRDIIDGADRDPPPLSEREITRRERILTLGQTAMAHCGRHGLTMGSLSLGLGIAVSALRRHFPDLDGLLIDLLSRHLRFIAASLAAIPNSDPDCYRKRRRAYIDCTRSALGGFNEAHLLLVRDRLQLPFDDLMAIEQHRMSVGHLLAGDQAEQALALLDIACLDLDRIETALAALAGCHQPPALVAPALVPPLEHPARETEAPDISVPAPPASQPPKLTVSPPPLPPEPDDDLARVGRPYNAVTHLADRPPNPPTPGSLAAMSDSELHAIIATGSTPGGASSGESRKMLAA